MISRLYGYFGIVGCASVLAWLAALVLLVVFVRSRQRGRFYLVTLGFAVVGLVLAQINSRRVGAIHPEEVANARKQYVEEITTEAGVPAYRQMGKQRRDTGKLEPVEQKSPERTLKEAQLLEANRLDRWNLLATRAMCLLVVLALIADYLVRFNHTTAGSYPLPIAGRWLDRVSPKQRAVLAGALDVPAYLETVVRRGETFLCFTATDPWPAIALPRVRKLWQLPKIVYGNPRETEFYFDAVWFNRYCVVVTTPDASRVFRQLEPYLNWRSFTKAAARQTVHVIWDLASAPPPALLEELITLVRETNFKLVVTSPVICQDLFEEVYGVGSNVTKPA